MDIESIATDPKAYARYQSASKEVLNALGVNLSPEQEAIFSSLSRNILVAGGERGGKSFIGALILVTRFICFGGDLFWLVGGEYEACRGEWDHIIELCSSHKLNILKGEPTKVLDPGLIILTGGAEIHTKSGRYPQKLQAVAPDGIILCEEAQLEYEIYLRCRGRVAEKRGWLFGSGSFEGSVGWFPEFFYLGQGFNDEGLASYSLPSWANRIIYPGGRQDPEIQKLERTMTRERFMERHGGEPCVPTDRVISEFSNRIHVGDYPFDPNLPVEIAVDPGFAGAYAVLAIQQRGEQLAVIDEVYLQGYITDDIITICKQRPWWLAVNGGAIDIAAKQHQAMEPVAEKWLKLAKVSLRMSRVNEEDGIETLRSHLKVNPVTNQSGLVVDAKCHGFIAECGGGKSPVEGGGMWRRDVNTRKPIDRNNHACKAMAYYLVTKFGYTKTTGRSRPKVYRLGGPETPRTYRPGW